MIEFENLLEQAENNPDDQQLIATLLVKSGQTNLAKLPVVKQERFYNLLAYVFANLVTGPHNALQTALQRALTQPQVLEFFWQRMEESHSFSDMLEQNAAAPVILALLCTHEDQDIAKRSAIALAYTRNEGAYAMLRRWQSDPMNKKLAKAAEIALAYFDEIAAGE